MPYSARSNKTKWPSGPHKRGALGMVKAFLSQNPGVMQEMPLNHSQDPKDSGAQLSKAQVRSWKEGQKQMRWELGAVRLSSGNQ